MFELPTPADFGACAALDGRCFSLSHVCATCGEHTTRIHDDRDVACFALAVAAEPARPGA